ncbi:MAG: FG-GAP-like repeat-containing protein [Chloroflexota bacterium]|nr:FG-GAP-like repeat-containing protein [Chloroflexota bacterium]
MANILNSPVQKKRFVGILILVVLLSLFLAFNRLPKLDTVRGDLEIVAAATMQCFQGFCIEEDPNVTLWEKWWNFSKTYLELVAIGMGFAFVVAGLAESFLFPKSHTKLPQWNSPFKSALKGLVIGPVWNLCSACIVPVSSAFARLGGGPAGAIGLAQGSSTLNIPALVMTALVFSPLLGISRIILGVAGGLFIAPLVTRVIGDPPPDSTQSEVILEKDALTSSNWLPLIYQSFKDWIRSTLSYVVRLGPLMVLAAFISGIAVQWITAETVQDYLGDGIGGVVLAATLGILINVPLMFEIPFVALLLILGMGTAPAATMLFTVAAGGPITFWGFAKLMPKRGVLAYIFCTWAIGFTGGVAILGLGMITSNSEETIIPARQVNVDKPFIFNDVEISESLHVTPFVNVASEALDDGYWVRNYRPGITIFDYDRDNDLDFFVTSESGFANFLYRNNGNGEFTNISYEAGVASVESNATGSVACDINNDGYQDLYVGSRGIVGDELDYRPALKSSNSDLAERIKDQLFLNNRDGTFTKITDHAFGSDVNIRSAASIACADVDGDGWLDIYVGNMVDEDFFKFNSPNHPGHFNVFYHNQGNLTFKEIASSIGIQGGQISMRDINGEPIMFNDPLTQNTFEGYDPTSQDAEGFRVGDPTSRTHAVMFFDHDNDGDPDLWLANDGDYIKTFRNDSERGIPLFTNITTAIDAFKVGNWMGFAVGDYDNDADLDVFVTNVGYHLRMLPPQHEPGGDCKYQERFEWGTCLHGLFNNRGTQQIPGLGLVPIFEEVAPVTKVLPSPIMPPLSLEPRNIHESWGVPTGLSAYDFGYGASFFDFDNDGSQDLYWLGSEIARGAGPGGLVYASAGRMLRGNGRGAFEDITVRARLLDILGVGYIENDPRGDSFVDRKIDTKFHENGKGLAHGDLNGDGYVDLIGTNSSGPVWEGSVGTMSPADGPLFVWMNGGGTNQWIKIRLQGRMAIDGNGTNADGIGARVFVRSLSGEDGQPLTQVKESRAGSSYISMNSLELEFGLGESITTVDMIVILWPSGIRQVLYDTPVNQSILVTEPEK